MDERPTDGDAYTRLLAFLDDHGARYRVLEHEPEGRTEIVSGYRGNAVAHAAKCLVVMVKTGKKTRRYLLAVVPGDAKVDLTGLKEYAGGSYASFATPEKAEALAGSVSGDNTRSLSVF